MGDLQAWSDESIYEGATGLCVVLVSVTLSEASHADDVRLALLDLVPKGDECFTGATTETTFTAISF